MKFRIFALGALVLHLSSCTQNRSEPAWPFLFSKDTSAARASDVQLDINERWIFDTSIVDAFSFGGSGDTLIHSRSKDRGSTIERRREDGSTVWAQRFQNPIAHIDGSKKGDVLFLETEGELIALGGSGHEMWRKTMKGGCTPRYLEEQQRVLCSATQLELLHWDGRSIGHSNRTERLQHALDWKNSNHWLTLSESGELSLYPQITDRPFKPLKTTKTQLFVQDVAWVTRRLGESLPVLAILGHPGLQAEAGHQRLAFYNLALEAELSVELPVRFSNLIWDQTREHLYLSADLPRGQYLSAYTVDWENKRIDLLWKTQHPGAARAYPQQFSLSSEGTVFKIWTHHLEPNSMIRTYLVEHDPNTGNARRSFRFENGVNPVFLVTTEDRRLMRTGVVSRLNVLEWLSPQIASR